MKFVVRVFLITSLSHYTLRYIVLSLVTGQSCTKLNTFLVLFYEGGIHNYFVNYEYSIFEQFLV